MHTRNRKTRLSRRQMFQAGGMATAWTLLVPEAALPAPPDRPASENIYTRIGVRPFINLTATYTINGGALMLPEVKQAMEEASRFAVNLDELMAKVSEQLAKLLGCEAGIVTCGCAAALTLATAAAVAGADPEKMARLPNLEGMRSEVIFPEQSRNPYDHAFRSVGAKLVEIDTREQFHAALGPRTALIAVLGTGEAKGDVRLEELVEAGKKAGVPVLVDAAAELPMVPNPYLARGADLVAYSGGKFLRGPQCAGLLLGRKDLVQAAWLNGSPHHGFGRSLKVGKEEIMGMLAAIELWRGRYDLQAEYRQWEKWYAHIGERLALVRGVRTRVLPPAGASPYPVLEVSWDATHVPITAGQLGKLLRDGEPRIVSHAEGEASSFLIRPVAMKPGEYKLVADRLVELLRAARPAAAAQQRPAPAAEIAGNWEVELLFVAGCTRHRMVLETSGNQVTGRHYGSTGSGEVRGRIDGNCVSLRSTLAPEGRQIEYEFTGTLAGGRLSGELRMDEYGRSRWSAQRSSSGSGGD